VKELLQNQEKQGKEEEVEGGSENWESRKE